MVGSRERGSAGAPPRAVATFRRARRAAGDRSGGGPGRPEFEEVSASGLILSPFGHRHTEGYADVRCAPGVAHYLPGGELDRTEARLRAERLADESAADWRQLGLGLWSVELPGRRGSIGVCGFTRLEPECLAISYLFTPACWGRGCATACVAQAMRRRARLAVAIRVVGLVRPGNLASCRVLEKNGLSRTGLMDYGGGLSLIYEAAAPPAETKET